MKVFSYRTNMNFRVNQITLHNDIGWGCMIRSGQMLFYNIILLKSLSNVDLISKPDGSIQYMRDKDFIFTHMMKFFDFYNDNSPFSFKNIFTKGKEKFNLNAREYWDSPRFLTVIKEITQDMDFDKFKLNLPSLRKTYGEDHIKFAQNVENNIKNLQILKISDGIVPVKKIKGIFENQPNSPLLVMPFILQLGKDISEKKYCPFLFRLLSLPWFSGMVGGKKKEAFYIFGNSQKTKSCKNFENSKLLYLDPHFVQDVLFGVF